MNGAVASEATRDLILVANDPITMAILDRIVAQPGLLRKEVAGTSGLTRTGAAWHVNKLVKFGIVREQRIGGQCHLYVVDSQEQALRTLIQPSRDPLAVGSIDVVPPPSDALEPPQAALPQVTGHATAR